MDNQIRKALKLLDCSLKNEDEYRLYSSEEFLKILSDRPHLVIRSVFQVFYDMIRTSIDEGIDEYPDDPESINYKDYDCSKLFVEGSDQPFFADVLPLVRVPMPVEYGRIPVKSLLANLKEESW